MLEIKNIDVTYSDVILALSGVNLEVTEGSVVALLGANGAGKTTTLKAISGLLAAEEGKIERGTIELDGMQIQHSDPTDIVKKGIIQVLEGRQILEHLTVQQNLILGAHLSKDRKQVSEDFDRVLGYFPKLKLLLNRTTGYLSGGEQQMVVMGRALMARPKIMLLDEPSLGLSPMMVEEIFRIIKDLNQVEKLSLLVVEQNAKTVLEIADSGYVMENGRIVLQSTAEELMKNEDVREFYLGLSLEGGRRNYREAKHYKRRKRWLG